MSEEHEEQWTVIDSWDEVPNFETEDDEREFWETHELGPGVLKDFKRAGVHPLLAKSKNVSIRMETATLHRLRVLAARKGMRYQTLLKEFVIERLYEEEKREGLVGP